MKVLVAASEMIPFSKTGGLADVAGALPKSLYDLGHDVRAIVPKYKMTDNGGFPLKLVSGDIEISIGQKIYRAEIFETKIPKTDVTVYLVGNEELFGRDGLYQENGKDYPDNAERFIFFCKAALEFLKKIGWEPHVIHCNDWQTALIPIYLKTVLSKDLFYNSIATVYTIHNMGYLGLFPAEKMPLTGLGWGYYTPDKLEFWGNVCFAKAGLIYSDIINTVSETYSHEIQTEEFGHGLDGLLRSRVQDVCGVVNGIDYDIWDPKTDPNLAAKYSVSDMKGKASDKNRLRKVMRLPQKRDTAVIGMVSRMTDQKGFDILSQAFPDIMKLPVQFVLLGAGDPKYQDAFSSFTKQYKGKVAINIGFDSAVAPVIYAGADIFLVPSLYEPCGLSQLISYKYGTIPAVRATGGLADTVRNYDPSTEDGDGFVFSEYTPASLYHCIERAVNVYKKDKKKWQALVKKVMKYDYSWDVSAKKYVAIYKKAIDKLRQRLPGPKARLNDRVLLAMQ